MDADWQNCLSLYLQSILDHSGSIATYTVYRATLARFFAFIGDTPPDQVKHADVLRFQQLPSTSPRNRGKEVTASTKNQRRAILSSFYHFTSRCRSELCFLRWHDIEATTIIDDDGTRHEGHVYRYRGKGSSREVKAKELPESGWTALTHYLEQAGRLATMQPNDYLFVSVHPGQGRQSSEPAPLHKAYITREFKRYVTLADLDPRFSLHTLRHSSARLRYTLGSSLQDIQHALDHSSIATTDLYIKRLAGTSDKGARLLEQRFSHLVKG